MKISRQKLVLERDKNFEYNYKITKTENVVEFVRNVLKIQNEPQEVCYLLTLDSRNKLVSFAEIGRGTIDMCKVLIADILKNVLLSNCQKFIILHNHPSGDSTPTNADIELTKRLYNAAELLQMQMLDHIVIGYENYQSCMQEI